MGLCVCWSTLRVRASRVVTDRIGNQTNTRSSPNTKKRLSQNTSAPRSLKHVTKRGDRYDPDTAWTRNCASVAERADNVVEVLDVQSSCGQVLKLIESEATRRFPNFVVASLGAVRKVKRHCVVTARILFDGTNGGSQSTLTKRGADCSRAQTINVREVSDVVRSLSPDVSEAHSHVPIGKKMGTVSNVRY